MVAVVPHLTVVAGCPGSGKTRHLLGLKEEGSIQEHLEGYLEGLLDFERNLRLLKLSLQMGCRIGISGQSFLEPYRRRLLENGLRDVPGLEIEWVFFEFDPKSCLENIIKDGLAGKEFARERVRRVLDIAERSAPEVPRNATIVPVVGRVVNDREIVRFFRTHDFGPDQDEVLKKVRKHLGQELGD
jgi:hypothetical protein